MLKSLLGRGIEPQKWYPPLLIPLSEFEKNAGLFAVVMVVVPAGFKLLAMPGA